MFACSGGHFTCLILANTIPLTNFGSMLVQRRRQWANIEPTSGELEIFILHLNIIRLSSKLQKWVVTSDKEKYLVLKLIK